MLIDDNESGLHRAGDNHFENIWALCASYDIAGVTTPELLCLMRACEKTRQKKETNNLYYQKDETFEKCEQIKVYGK